MRSIQGVLVLALGLYSSAALALGLGNIRVLSRPGQPLVAEIPVISSDPGELDNATVGLASAATFERVGLSRPEGLVGELQFQFAQDAQGRAVVRVTSAAPVQVPALSFLIEVDWGQGRLVREYSALVATPETATAVAEPVIEAPAAAPSNLIVRDSEPAPRAAAEPAREPAAVPVPAPAPARPAAPAPVARAAATVDGALAPVQRGQTLSQIAGGLARDSGTSLDQAMVALLHANPEAFIRGNLNLLRQGAVLRVPGGDELARTGAAEARAIVREHAAQWRQARAPIPQPAVAGNAASAVTKAEAVPAASSDARLEIAPAVAGAHQTAGMTTGLEAGGEGDMAANEQLRQAREDLATRDAELQELRERVAELEKLQTQQQSLIAMKDSDLAAAQQRLADAAKKAPAGSAPWAWLGLALLLMAAVGWWLSRRRKPSPLPPAPRAGHAAGAGEPSALAAAMPALEEEIAAEVASAPQEPAAVAADAEAVPFWSQPVADVVPSRATRQEPVLLFEASLPVADDAGIPEPSEPAMPEQDDAQAGDMASLAPLNPAPAGRERLELAIAYLDLGDAETARTLLNEVATGSDPQARAEAVELLGRLG